jgi:phosphoglycolate phosphatase
VIARALIVFDLDGTLVDSRLDLAESTNEMLGSYGRAGLPVDDVARMVGDGARRLVERALAASGLEVDVGEALDRFRAVYDRRLLVHTRPYPGIPELVARAAESAALAVLTNKPEPPSRRLLEAFALSPRFGWVIGGDSGFPRKPDPAGLRHLMSAADVPPARTLVVGDSMIDVETARRADASVCVAKYGFGHLRGGLLLRPGEAVAEAPAEVAAVIARFLEATPSG